MKQWQTIGALNLYSKNVRIGMWPYDDKIYFSVEDLKPEDFVDSDTWEFPIYISDLEKIVAEAKRLTNH